MPQLQLQLLCNKLIAITARLEYTVGLYRMCNQVEMEALFGSKTALFDVFKFRFMPCFSANKVNYLSIIQLFEKYHHS